MDEFPNDSLNPFDRFLASPNLDMLNSALPYVGDSIRKPLALYIKMAEIHRIVADMDNEAVLSACGFEDNTPNIEAALRAMKAVGGKEGNAQLDSMLHMLEMFHTYQSFMDLMQKNPELINIINNMMGPKENSDMLSMLSEVLKKQEL